MSQQIQCNRIGCANNVVGTCALSAPAIIEKEAFNDCLDHKNKE